MDTPTKLLVLVAMIAVIFMGLSITGSLGESPAQVKQSVLATQSIATQPAMTGDWKISYNNKHYGGTAHWTGTKGDYVTLSITGNQVQIGYTGRPGRGKMDVYIDNQKIATFSQYAATATYQMKWESPTFAQGNHVLTLVNAEAGKSVDLDFVTVYDPPTINDMKCLEDDKVTICYQLK